MTTTTHNPTHNPAHTATTARDIGGLLYLLSTLMEQALEDGTVDRADLYLAQIADLNSHIDDMTDNELRSLVNGLLAQVVEARRARHRILDRRAGLAAHLATE